MNMQKILIILACACLCNGLKAQKQYPCEIEISKKAQKLYQQAMDAQKKGDADRSTALLKACCEEQEDWAVPYYQLGMKTVRQLQESPDALNPPYRRAINYFEKVVALCPQYNLTAYLHLGKLYYAVGEYAKAVSHLDRFTEDPEAVKSSKNLEEAEWFLQFSRKYAELYGNPVPFSPVPVPGLSTADDEYLASITPDNEYMLFTRKQIYTSVEFGRKKSEMREVFSISQCQPDSKFDAGRPMPSPPFNVAANEGSPTLTADNKYMVFTRCTDAVADNSGVMYTNCDLYFSEFKNNQWTNPQNLGNAINLPNTWESQASISADGNLLFFVSDRPGGYGGYDIYFSVRNSNGVWQKALNAGKIINTVTDEKTPFLHPDNKTLYFASRGFTGLGGYDIHITHLKDDKTWSTPKNIGYPINSEKDDLGLFVSLSGETAYFATNSFGDNWNICQFELYNEARPNKVLLVKGSVDNIEELTQIKVELTNVRTKQILEINTDETTGQYAAVINETNDDYLLTVKENGYAYEAKYIQSKKIVDEGISQIKDIRVTLLPIEVGHSYKINDIHFATNSYDLTNASKEVLGVLIDFLQDNPAVKIEIQGHTDNIGSRESNMILSQNRAQNVHQYLISNHISASRLAYKGFADTKPVADNQTEAGRAQNRRTVFVITAK
jgi:outer membrane protein OmpA-like peptidoglycan-associated protein